MISTFKYKDPLYDRVCNRLVGRHTESLKYCWIDRAGSGAHSNRGPDFSFHLADESHNRYWLSRSLDGRQVVKVIQSMTSLKGSDGR